MHVFDLVGRRESDKTYQTLEAANVDRQYSFLKSVITASLELNRDMFSLEVIRALHYHAVACLHAPAGEFRPCKVTVGEYRPPPHHQVPALMNMFVDEVNRKWEISDPIFLATFVLWRLNHIHPFVNGNGRTARAASYFVLCLKFEKLLEGDPILPQLIKDNRPAYVAALQVATDSHDAGSTNLMPLHDLLSGLLDTQRQSAE